LHIVEIGWIATLLVSLLATVIIFRLLWRSSH
jgi:hypothetical protein